MGRSQNRIAYYRDRCAPPLSQTGLASALGLHINTVQRWERDGVPSTLELLRLTRFFVAQGAITDETAARAFWASGGREELDVPSEFGHVVAEALAAALVARMPTDVLPDPTPPASCFMVPLRPNPLFVGRERELLTLAALVKGAPGDAHAPIVALTGIGGVGKTQLAVAFAHHYGAFFPGGVFWFNCADPAALPEAVAASGGPGALDLRPDYERLSLPTRGRLVQAAWRAPTPRLLIFDNCEDEALLQTWLPTAGGCRVLLTSQRAQWDATLGVQTLALPGLTRAASQALLRCHRPDLVDTEPGLDALAAALGDLPLALHLAGRFLAREGVSPQVYLAHLQQAPSVLQHPSMQQGGVSPTFHTQHLDQTIALSVECLDPAMPADRLALAMLARAARCAPGAPLPRSLLLALIQEDDREALEVYEAAALERAAGDLSLLERIGEMEGEATFRLHPLIAAFLQAHSDSSDAQAAAERALLHMIDGRLVENRLPAPLLLEHLQYLAAAALPRRDVAAAQLASTLGWQLLQRSRLEEAQHYLEQAHAISVAVLGSSHLETARALNLLALHWDIRNEHRWAHPLYERALAIFEQTLGADHPDTSTCCNNLGLSLCNSGDYGAAHRYLLRALAAREAQNPNSADTARTLNNFGQLLTYLELWDDAQQMLARALAIREQVLLAAHPSTAQTLNNLGVVFYERGDYAAAQHYHARAHTTRVAVFGPEHNDVAESLYNLGRVAAAEGDFQQAETLLQQALSINTRLFEPGHVEIASHQVALAQTFGATGRARVAHALLEQALIGLEAHYGEDHREVANALIVLAPILDALGDAAGAAAARTQADAIQTVRRQHQNLQGLVPTFVL